MKCDRGMLQFQTSKSFGILGAGGQTYDNS